MAHARRSAKASPEALERIRFLHEVKRLKPLQISDKLNEEGMPGPGRKGRWFYQAVVLIIAARAGEKKTPLFEPTVLPEQLHVARHHRR